MNPTCRRLYRDWDDALGGLREDFFVEAMTLGGAEMEVLTSTRGAETPDDLVEIDGQRMCPERKEAVRHSSSP